MAEVQLALQRGPAGFEKLVVVKLVHENLASQKDFVDMLLDEARVAALVKHPNVVDIYDLGQADGRFFIAMEYLEGEPLLAVLRAGREGNRLDPLSSARLISDTAEGLDAAHELRTMGGDLVELVHHDISLGNIVVLYNGQVKLVDFGVAKATQTTATRNRVQGKFSYMAPEKLIGGAGDRRSDIWSLGCVMWEALTLRRLFKGGNDHDTMHQVLNAVIPLPSKANPVVPSEFDRIVMKALAREPEDRYATARELAQDIEEVLRQKAYGGRNDQIAKWMQTTFDAHITARKKLLQEVSSKGRASAAVLEAAFAEPQASAVHGSMDVSGMFSVKFRGGNSVEAEGTPSGTARGTPHNVGPSRDPRSSGFKLPSAQIPPIDDGAKPLVDGDVVKLSPDAQRSRTASMSPEKLVVPPGHATRVDRRRTYAIALAIGVILLGVIVGLVVRHLRAPGEPEPPQIGPAPAVLPGANGAAAEPVADAAEAATANDAVAAVGDAELSIDDALIVGEVQVQPIDEDEIAMEDENAAVGSGGPGTGSGGSQRPIKPRPKVSAAEHTKHGLNAFVRGDVKGALALYRKAIAADGSYAPAWRAAGIAHERLGDRAAAKAAFQKYLQLSPAAADADQIKQRMENL